MTLFGPEIIQAIKAHAVELFPEESCGLVAGGRYIPCENIAEDRRGTFRIGCRQYLAALEEAGTVQAVIHSHPNGPNHPTRSDMVQQLLMDVPWGIVVVDEHGAKEPFWFGDQLPTPQLLGRTFRHGVTDCYALIRDWFKTAQSISLPQVPRDDEWWKQGKNLYLDHFQRAGFVQIEKPEKVGDCVIGCILSKQPNHAGVYLGNGLVLHHLANRLSRREPLGPWMKYITHVFRHKDLMEPC